MDYSLLGTVQLTKILIEKFKTDRGEYANASHKFYSIRKKMASETGCQTFMNVQPKNFFYALKCHNEEIKLKKQSIERNAKSHQSRYQQTTHRYQNFDGDFDDLDCSKQSNEYFYHNKRYNKDDGELND